MDVSDQNELYKTFNILELAKEPVAVCEVLHLISNELHNKYKNGKCANCMINGEDIFKVETKIQPTPEAKLEVIPEVKKNVEIRSREVPITIVSKKPSWMCC